MIDMKKRMVGPFLQFCNTNEGQVTGQLKNISIVHCGPGCQMEGRLLSN